MIHLHRLPITKPSGAHNALVQYNTIDRKAKGVGEYHKEVLREIEQHITNQTEINNIIIMGDYNQDITSNEIKSFFNKIKLWDIHQSYNLIPENNLDKTYIRGLKCIDSVAITQNLLDLIKGSKLLEANKVTKSDHRVLLIDINLEEYFKETMSS